MKKSLIALAVAGVFASPLAMADDVKVYGTVDMSFGSSSNGVNSGTQVSSNTTKLGFKGTEDLGDGLAAVWQIEQQIDIDNGSTTAGSNNPTGNQKNTFASRNSFLGLKSDSMGTVLAGIHDTPYKIATRHMDIFGDGIGDNRAIMGAAHDARVANALAYISPKLSDSITIAAAYVAGAELNSTNAAAGGFTNKGDAFSLAAMYDQDALKVHFGYQKIKIGTALSGSLSTTGVAGTVAGDETTASKLGVGYDFGSVAVNGVYEHISSSGITAGGLIGNAYGRNSWTLNGAIKVSDNDKLKLAYATRGNVGSVANTGAKQYSLGYDHSFSKHTTLYAVYSSVSNSSAATVGLANTSTGNPTAAGAAGKTVNAFGIGVKHSF